MGKNLRLSKNFSLREFTRSQTAARLSIDNHLCSDQPEVQSIQRLVDSVLQPIRDALGPVHITSGYRSPELNKAIGGSENSQHCQGLAADIVVSGYTPIQVANWCMDNLDEYDQLIHEFGEWVHISIAADSAPRYQELTAIKSGGRTVYLNSLLTIEAARKYL